MKDQTMTKENAYKQAGVDTQAGADLVQRLKPHVKKTHRSGVMGGLGGFGAVFDLKETGYDDPLLVSSTDGVGTKIKIAIDMDLHDTIGIDAVAMCVNDLVVQGAEPLYFLDYFACGRLDVAVAEKVIAGVAAGCEQAGCALIGGETAEMPGLYAEGDYDLAGFTVGAVERDQLLDGRAVQAGDVILALASDGVHSNGFSLVRRIVSNTQGYHYEMPMVFSGKTLGQEVLTPTRIYVRPILEVLKEFNRGNTLGIHAMAHITGGGLDENIPRVIPDGLCARIDAAAWDLPPIFCWLAEAGNLKTHDMAQTFNCGIGMAVVCAADQAVAIRAAFEDQGETVFTIGEIVESAETPIEIVNTETAWAIGS